MLLKRRSGLIGHGRDLDQYGVTYITNKDKKLSCRKEAVRHSMSLEILLVHSRSFEIAPLSRARV